MTDRDPGRPTLGQLYDGGASRHPGPVMPDLPGSLGQMYVEWSGEASSLDVLGDSDIVLAPQTIDTRGRRRRGTSRPAPVRAPTAAAPEAPQADPTAPATDSGIKSVARSSAIMAGGTFVSRILGLVRTVLLVALFGGQTVGGNVYDIANTLPNMIYILLAGGVINAVLVPQITRALLHRDGGKGYTDRLLTLALSILAAVTVIFLAVAPFLYRLFDSDATSSSARLHLGTMFALICLPQILFYGIYALFGEVLNARSNFGPLMWSPALANIVAIGGIVWCIAHSTPGQAGNPAFWDTQLIVVLGGTATLGIIVQALVLIIPMRRVGYRFTPNFHFRGVGLRTASHIAGWAFAAVVVQQLSGFVATRVISTVGDGFGGKQAFSNAFMLFMLPHSLVTLSLITALYTRMSKAANAGRTKEVLNDVRTGLRLSGLASIPVSVGCLVLIIPMVIVLFGNGNRMAYGYPTIGMMLGLVPFTICVLVQRVFYAYEDAKTPFWMQLVCTVLTVALSVSCLALPDRWVAAGLALSQSIAYVVQATVGWFWLRRRLGEMPIRDVANTYGRLGIAAIAGTGVALVLRVALSAGVGDSSRASNLLILVVAGVAFLLVYVVTARRLKVTEIDQLVSPLTGRLSRLVHR
ncbi:murein biosynthesis integral membrane protein MurJ [Leekyejoonella antrihumi]|nr:murein biosynthesis integral membrane protein MurJ [Leekyejoonella antrihumi]